MSRGEMFILSAPSGTGKTTLIQRMMEGPLASFGDVVFSVSHTTRRPRSGESDGRDYHFVEEATFRSMIDEGAFLEWAEYNRRLYGTSRQEVFPRLERGLDVILDIEVQGAEQVLTAHPEAHGIFLMPPSYADLERRLRGRALDESPEIARRLNVSIWEIGRYKRYDYVIVNDDLDRASHALAAIILDKRYRLGRIAPRILEVLKSFEGVR